MLELGEDGRVIVRGEWRKRSEEAEARGVLGGSVLVDGSSKLGSCGTLEDSAVGSCKRKDCGANGEPVHEL